MLAWLSVDGGEKGRPLWRVKRSQPVGYALAFSASEELAEAAGGYFESFFAASASAAC